MIGAKNPKSPNLFNFKKGVRRSAPKKKKVGTKKVKETPKVPDSVYDELAKENRQRFQVEQTQADLPAQILCFYDRDFRTQLSRVFSHLIDHPVKQIAVFGPGRNLSELLFLLEQFPDAKVLAVERNKDANSYLKAKIKSLGNTHPVILSMTSRLTLVEGDFMKFFTDDRTKRHTCDLVYFSGHGHYGSMPWEEVPRGQKLASIRPILEPLREDQGTFFWVGGFPEWIKIVEQFYLRLQFRAKILEKAEQDGEIFVFQRKTARNLERGIRLR